MNEQTASMLKYMRLHGLLKNWDSYLSEATKQNWSYDQLLTYIVEEEYRLKKENSARVRLSRARIPEKLVMETFPFDKQPKMDKRKVLTIYDAFDYMPKCLNIIFVGPTGTGKTGLATAFLIQTIEHGYNGRFILFPELVEMLYKSVADHSEARLIKTFSSYGCLLIDEIGYVEVEPIQVGLFFTLMHKRHKTKTTLITSNLGFAKWGSFLK